MKFSTSFYVLFALASGLGAAAEAEVGFLEVCLPIISRVEVPSFFNTLCSGEGTTMETMANMKAGTAMDGATADMATTRMFTIVMGTATVMAAIITVMNGMARSGGGMASGMRGMGRSLVMKGTTITSTTSTIIVMTTTTASIVTTSIATTRKMGIRSFS